MEEINEFDGTGKFYNFFCYILNKLCIEIFILSINYLKYFPQVKKLSQFYFFSFVFIKIVTNFFFIIHDDKF